MPFNIKRFKVRIDEKNKIIFVKMARYFNEKKAIKLRKHLEKLKSHYYLFNFIIILPKKLKFTQKAKGLLIDFIKEQKLIVAASPIQRAMLKTEVTFNGENINYICDSEIEALNKIKI